MNISKQALIAIFVPFLAITVPAMAMDMDMKKLVKFQVNQLMEEPFEHDKYQPKPSYVIGKNRNYISLNNHNSNTSIPNVIEIAKQQRIKEIIKFKAIAQQYTPQNEQEWDLAQKQIDQLNTRNAAIRKSAEDLQQKLIDNALAKKLSFTKSSMDEILQRPFQHEKKCPITIQLTENPKIGYLDTTGVEDFNEILPVQAHDPFVTITSNIDQKLLKNILLEQVTNESVDCNILLNKLNTNNDIEREEKTKQTKRFDERKNRMVESASNLTTLQIPPIFPIKYLQTDDSCNINNTSVCLNFKEDKKLNTLLTTFKQQPTTLFCHLTPESATRLRLINGEALENEDKKIIQTEVDAIKTDFRNKKIVERKPYGDVLEDQDYSYSLLPNSDIVTHYCNYHQHGENGHSDKRTRDEALANLNPNAFGFLNDRENGYKKRKLSSNTKIIEDIQ